MMVSVLPLMLLFLFHFFLPHIELLFNMLREVRVTLCLILWLLWNLMMITVSYSCVWVTYINLVITGLVALIRSRLRFFNLSSAILELTLSFEIQWWLFLLPASLILSELIVSHLDVIGCWDHLLVIRSQHQIGILLLDPTLGIWINRTAFIYLFCILSNTVILEVGSVANSSKGTWVNFVHHRIIDHGVTIITGTYVNLTDALGNHLTSPMMALTG